MFIAQQSPLLQVIIILKIMYFLK